MKPSEASALLTRISAADNREVTQAGALHWAECLPDVRLADALEYLPQFYRAATQDTRAWIHPGDVLQGVRELLAKKRSRAINAAREAALTAIANDRDHVEDLNEAGRDLNAFRATRAAIQKAAEQWDQDNPMPGAEIDAEKRRKEITPW